MRKELQIIELIENYLMGNLSDQANTAFEQRMRTDESLRNQVALQQQLVEGLERMGLKADIKAAKQKVWWGKIFRYIAYTLMTVTIVSAIWWFNSLPQKNKESTEPIPVENHSDEALENTVFSSGDSILMSDSSKGKDSFANQVDSSLLDSNPSKQPNLVVKFPTDTQTDHKDFHKAVQIPKKKAQYFTIDPTRDTILKGKEGTLIEIDANSFQTTSKEPIRVSLKEYYKISDIVFSNLTTQTNSGEMIETGGMVYIEASNDKETNIQLKKEKPITIKFPFEEKKEGMELFLGKENRTGNIVWDDINKEDSKDTIRSPILELGEKEIFRINSDPFEYTFTRLEKMPTYPGCTGKEKERNKCTRSKIEEYIMENFLFPEKAFRKKELNHVSLQFIIDPRGLVAEVEVKGADKEVNKEVERVVKTLPKLDPGLHLRKGRRVKYVMPLQFEPKNFERGYKKSTVNRINDSIVKVRKEGADRALSKKIMSNSSKWQNKKAKYELINDIEYYALKTTDVGYINADRYFKNGTENVNFSTHVTKGDVRFKMILHENKSVSQAQIYDGEYKFINAPKGQKATLFSIKIMNERPHVALQEITISKRVPIDLNYELLTKETLERYTQQLDQYH